MFAMYTRYVRCCISPPGERIDGRRTGGGLRSWATACHTRRVKVLLRHIILGGCMVTGSAVRDGWAKGQRNDVDRGQ